MKIIDIPRSGSYADKTSSRNRAGQYVRNRRAPVQPVGSGRRAVIRAAFGSASSAWAGLNDGQRAAWISFADGVPYVDSLGQSIKLTGHQMFVAVNTQRLNCGLAVSNTPPVSTTVPVLSNPVCSSDTSPALAFDVDSTGGASDFVLVQVSPQLSAGRSFNNRFWQAKICAGNNVTDDIITEYVSEFGTPQLGKKIFFKFTPVNQYGVTGAPTITSVVVNTP